MHGCLDSVIASEYVSISLFRQIPIADKFPGSTFDGFKRAREKGIANESRKLLSLERLCNLPGADNGDAIQRGGSDANL